MTSGEPDGKGEIDRSDHHKHMDYVQAVITRLANNSFLMKGWALTLSSALLGFAIAQKHAGLALSAIVPAAAFWMLDTYYLRQERAFREMYDDVAAKCVRDFKIDPKSYAERQSWRVGLSISLRIFYLAVIVLTLGVAAILASASGPQSTPQNPLLPPSNQEPSGEHSPSSSYVVESSQPASPVEPSASIPSPSGPAQSSAFSTPEPSRKVREGYAPAQP